MLPLLVLTALCLPDLRLGYFWDDYYYLTKGQSDPMTYLVPHRGAMSYRPIPEGFYFLSLLALGPAGSLFGHLFNLALLGLSVILLGSLASQLWGRSAGLWTGLAFAALGPMPTLVAWISCAPDAFAIALFLVALRLRHAGRALPAFAVAAAGLFSKESVLALFPVLVGWDWILGRKPHRLALHGLLYSGLFVLWAATHPAFRSLLNQRFQAGHVGYLGLGSLDRVGLYFGQYALTLFNVPVTGLSTPWPGSFTAAGIAALAVLLVAVWLDGRSRPGGSDRSDGPNRPDRNAAAGLPFFRTATLGVLLTLPSLLLPSLLIGRWNPYFVCLAALGTSLLMGRLLATAPRVVAASVLTVFLILGVWCRGLSLPGGLSLTEQDCVGASKAIHRVEEGFLYLHGSLPRGAQVLLSVGETGKQGIYGTMLDGQAPRIWYGDPSIQVLTPSFRRAGVHPEFLFRISPSLDVIEIDPSAGTFRTSGGPPGFQEIERPLRTYARALAATGEVDRGVRIFLELQQTDPGNLKILDRRYAAMLLIATRRDAEAAELVRGVPEVPRDLAIQVIAKVFEESAQDTTIEQASFPAFGVDPGDVEAIRVMMRRTSGGGHWQAAHRLAGRVQFLRPGDRESLDLMREIRSRWGQSSGGARGGS